MKTIKDIDLKNKPLAIAIGKKETLFGKLGYGILDTNCILEDILFNNKNLDCNAMCQDRFRSIAINRLMPVFKYVRGASCGIDPNSKLGIYIASHDSYDKIVSKNLERRLQKLDSFKNLNDLHNALETIPEFDKKSALLLRNIRNFRIEDIKEECKKLFQIYNYDKYSTHFLRCIMYIDLMENK